MAKQSNKPTDVPRDDDHLEIPCVKKYKCKTLQIGETKYRTLLTSKFENRKKYIAGDPGLIISVLPGTIIDILVKSGQKIVKGQTLLIFEAMKMNNRLISSLNGEVKEIYVKKGEKISKGQSLVLIT